MELEPIYGQKLVTKKCWNWAQSNFCIYTPDYFFLGTFVSTEPHIPDKKLEIPNHEGYITVSVDVPSKSVPSISSPVIMTSLAPALRTS